MNKKNMEDNKIVRFRNLSWPLKVLASLGIINVIYYILIFIARFIIGFAGAL